MRFQVYRAARIAEIVDASRLEQVARHHEVEQLEMAVDVEGGDAAADVDLGDAPDEHDGHARRNRDDDGRGECYLLREEGAIDLKLGAVEEAHDDGPEERNTLDERCSRDDVEDQRVDLDAGLPMHLRLVVLPVEIRADLATRRIEVAVEGDVRVEGRISQHRAVDEAEG